jgi:hypothetical protein
MLRRSKVHILGLFIAALAYLSPLVAQARLLGESPYTRLRVQFLKAEKPTLKDFQPGKPWHCSSSLEAAKGQLRYVSLWEHRYLWAPGEAPSELSNQHEFFAMQVDLNESSGEYDDLFGQPVVESFRVQEDGHLIVEVATLQGSFQQMSHREPSLLYESLTAQNYYLCMNPEWQSNDDWDYNRDQVFGSDSSF